VITASVELGRIRYLPVVIYLAFTWRERKATGTQKKDFVYSESN
jgi:hypothetical protein